MRFLVPLIAVFSLAFAGPSMAQGVANPGFESGVLAPWTCTVDANGDCLVSAASTNCEGVPRSGTYYLCGYENVGSGLLAQTLSTTPGTKYIVSAYFNGSQAINTGSIALCASAPVPCTVTPGTYTLCTSSFVATTTSDAVRIGFATQSGSGTVWVDDVSVTGGGPPSSVPALSEWGMLALGLILALSAGLYLRRRRS
jgi:chitinase